MKATRYMLSLSLALITPIALLILLSACHEEEEQEVTPKIRVTIDGKIYETVKIGTQIWTSVNYSGTGGVEYDAANSKPEYGRYYSKAELAAIELPKGWRIPSKQDYIKMAETYNIPLPAYMGSTEGIRGFISTINWNNVVGTNSSGFNAQPAGYIFGESAPSDGDIAEFWTSEGSTLSIQEGGTDPTSLRMIFYGNDSSPDYKFNVRFVRN